MWVSHRKPFQVINNVDWPFLVCIEGLRRFSGEVQSTKPVKPKKLKFYNTPFYHGLQECIKTKDPIRGREVHSLIVVYGHESDAFLSSHLIRMLVACNNLPEANHVFSKLHNPNLYAWSEIILANSKHGQSEKALDLFEGMQKTLLKLDKFVLVPALMACACLGALIQGHLIHGRICEDGLESNPFIRSALIDMYVKCMLVGDARSVFDYTHNEDVVIWNAMIAGYALNGYCLEAFQLIQHMQKKGPAPNDRTWTSLLAGFAQHGQGEDAIQVFEQMLNEGVHPDVVAWNAMISGYALHGHGHEALSVFHCMIREGEEPNKITLLCGLKSCASIGDLNCGKFMHDYMINSGFASGLAVATTLIDMYAKCGALDDAQNLFDSLSTRDAVVWNSLIAGYTLYGHGLMALQLFQQMQKEGMMPDNTTLLTILKVCTLTTAMEKGKLIHAFMVECDIDVHEFAGSSLIDMYACCGSLEDACKVLRVLPKSDSVSWNALLAGFALYSDYHLVHQQFEDMQAAGLVPDEVTFISLLSSCSYLGLVEEGSLLFNSMQERYGITPGNEHYGCMVDLLGRAGLLVEAEDLLFAMPFHPNVIPWTSLLNNCRIYNDLQLGERCFKQVVAADPTCASSYALMSLIYAGTGFADESEILGMLREQSNAWKKPGKTFIEVDCEVHGFVVGDVSHFQNEDIYAKIELLNMHLKRGGHVCSM